MATKSFLQAKLEFDKKFSSVNELNNFLPEHLTQNKKSIIKRKMEVTTSSIINGNYCIH